MGMGVLNDPLDIVVQDNAAIPIEAFLYQPLNDITVLSGFTPGSNTFTLDTGHNFVNPNRGAFTEDFINIQYVDEILGARNFQTRVLNVTGDVIIVGHPAGIGASVANIIKAERINVDLAVTGSLVSPIEFKIEAFSNLVFDLQVFSITMITDSAPDDGKFGDLDALPNGLYFGQRKSTLWGYLTNLIDNGEIAAFTKGISYSARTVPLGSYGISSHKSLNGPDGSGVVVRLNGSTGDRLSAFVQDDLSTLRKMRIKAFGHTAVETIGYSLDAISVPLNAGEWTKVLEGVQSGTLFVSNREKSNGDTTFLATMVPYKGTAPTSEAPGVVLKHNVETPFNRREKVDVYVKSTNIDSQVYARI